MKEEKQATLGEVNAANPVKSSRDVLNDNKATWEHEDLAKVWSLFFSIQMKIHFSTIAITFQIIIAVTELTLT